MPVIALDQNSTPSTLPKSSSVRAVQTVASPELDTEGTGLSYAAEYLSDLPILTKLAVLIRGEVREPHSGVKRAMSSWTMKSYPLASACLRSQEIDG